MSSEQSKGPVMPSKQGDVGLLQDPVAQQLLQVKGPAHLAYTWRDGTPRVIPMGFHWNGQEIVMATTADAPKTKVLTNGSQVAVSIDSDFAASQILLMVPSPDGARRRVIEEETQNTLEARRDERLYQRALSDPRCPIRTRKQGLEAA